MLHTFYGAPVMWTLDLAMVLYTIWVLRLAPETKRYTWPVGLGLLVWLAGLHVALSSGRIFPADISGALFYGVILAGVAAVGVLLLGVRPVRRLVTSLSQRQLMLLQGIRVYFGAGFLIQGGLGLLPSTFGLLDGLTHISAGFLCLLAAFTLTWSDEKRWHVWGANLFGLGDILVVATTLAFVLLEDIGPHHPMMYAVFLPAPLWLWAHVVSLHGLTRRARRGALV